MENTELERTKLIVGVFIHAVLQHVLNLLVLEHINLIIRHLCKINTKKLLNLNYCFLKNAINIL